MNKLFGFFKEKIVQAKVQNKKQLQSLVSVLSGDDTGYKADIILSHLQKIKSNYMTWSILIANQASTGLYYSQLHNHAVCLKKAGQQKQFETTKEKYYIIHEQMKKTHHQLKEIAALSENWVTNISQNIQQIKLFRTEKLRLTKAIKQEKVKKFSQEQIDIKAENKVQDEQEKNKKQQVSQEISPIIFSESSSPVIQFFQSSNNSVPIIHTEKW